jgi:undecaprenyl-diphosphatase
MTCTSGRPSASRTDRSRAAPAPPRSRAFCRTGKAGGGSSTTCDLAVYVAVAATTTPTLVRVLRRLSRATQGHGSPLPQSWRPSAEHATAAPQSTAWPPIAVTSAVANLLLKPLGRRVTHHVPITRHVTMPRTASFPSGHAASASAFATGVATAWPEAGLPLSAAATLVGYSGVHPGVHYPVDVIAGSLTGTHAGAAHRRRARAPPRPRGQRFERHLP